MPSVRSDVPLPAARSVANTKNYGNEPTAGQLLTPLKCVDLGVKEEHLLAMRNREEIMQLLRDAGISTTDDEFEAIFGLAAELDGVDAASEKLQCSLDSFMKARYQLMQQQAGLV